MYIINEAFNFKSATGGILSSVAIYAMSSGLSKGLFTNEAGMGTSPLFDITVNEQDITKQSIISSTTVFVDTVLLCTITGIIFVASGMYQNILNPNILAENVFSILPLGKYIYMFFICIFAISTIPCSGYYGSVSIRYLFKDKAIYEIIYKLVFLFFVYLGCTSKSLLVWSISSIANGLMILPNIYMLFYLRKEIE
jgi:AGCS family alanine or glycine:cation symporter